MHIIDHQIRIGKYLLNLVEEVSVKTSIETLTDTATIKVYGYYLNKIAGDIDEFKTGDTVSIRIGYLDSSKNPEKTPLEFEGYVSGISAAWDKGDYKITITCHDWMNLLPKVKLKNEHYCEEGMVNVQQIFADIVEQVNQHIRNEKTKEEGERIFGDLKGFGLKCNVDFDYTSFTVLNYNAMDLIKDLQEELGLYVYLREGTIYVRWVPVEGKKVTYDMARNVERSSLEYGEQKAGEVRAEGSDKEGKTVNGKPQAEEGQKNKEEEDKEIVKIPAANNERHLEYLGKIKKARTGYTGYRGDITAWLKPYTRPGDIVVIKDKDFPADRQVEYFVNSVDISLTEKEGGVRKVTLGMPVANVPED